MPTYDFLNTESGEIEEHFVTMSGLDQFQEDNPHLKKQVTAPGVAFEANQQISTNNLPNWFKDIIVNVAEGPGVKHTAAGERLKNYYK